MRMIVFALTFLTLSFSVLGQTFEGYIVYQNVVKSKNPTVSDAQFLGLVGSTQKSFYAGEKGLIEILVEK